MEMKKIYPLIVLLSAIVFFIPFLGSVHLFDWDEINFAESAREMIVTGNYSQVQIDFQPFWEKPPLFFWLQAMCMNIFGINEFAARLPNAFIGIVTLITFYFIGKKLFDEKFGFIWSLAYLGSFLPHLYFKSGIIDPVFNYFIFISVYFIALSYKKYKEKAIIKYAIIGGISLGLATLTKGPVAFLVVFLTIFIYWVSSGFKKIFSSRFIIIFLSSFIIISSIWFGWEVLNHGSWFINEFVKYQLALFLTPVAGHAQPFYYHFVIVFLGCFPISILALPLLIDKKSYLKSENSIQNPAVFKNMLILFWVVMILFSIVKTKIVHYSSLAYFPLSFFAAYYIYNVINNKANISRYALWFLAFIGMIFSLLLMGLPIIAQHKELLIPYLKDPFAVACLKTNVHWSGYEFLIGFAYLISLIIVIFILRIKKYFRGFILLFYSTALCLFIYLIAVVPKIESYSQAPAINFYKSIAGKDAYAVPYGFKSYAQYFYFQKMPTINKQSRDIDWLLNGNIDKPVYFVAKNKPDRELDSHPDCQLIKEEGGFLFYLRLPSNMSK